MKLSNLKAGTRAKIHKILEEKEVKIKLMSLGLNLETEVIMIKNDFKGAVILAIDDNRIILGRDLANKIEISEE
jgi:Fe2+ transport system protein FeoA